MNHFWKRWREEYLVELRNSHRYAATQSNTDRIVSTEDVVVVHDEDQPRGKWRIGKVEDLIAGADGSIRGAVVRVQGKGGKCATIRRPVQRLYPLEIRCQVTKPAAMSRLVPDSTVTCARPEQSGPRQCRPRRAAAGEADRRRKTWL